MVYKRVEFGKFKVEPSPNFDALLFDRPWQSIRAGYGIECNINTKITIFARWRGGKAMHPFIKAFESDSRVTAKA